MNPDHQQEKALFIEALERPSEPERRAFLDQACSGNPALRARLDQLLDLREEAEAYFPPSLYLTDSGDSGAPPPIIDRYRLLRRIGQGACGVVYLAKQTDPVQREVALKIIRLGMDTENVIARFSIERQALALMDHPNIARVYDAGATPSGRPYFVMEYVRGLPLTTYCDEHALDVRQRLELFIQVCHAVSHAHQRGIVHRDIKPANILVTLQNGVPTPKLIDFGIAKAIDERIGAAPHVTTFSQIIGTPAYMSPEQVLGDASQIDTRCDIYSLGALLYELLAGQPPFSSEQLTRQGLPGLIRILGEITPSRPSSLLAALPVAERETRARHRNTQPPRLLRALRHDLDWIVMKAVEKSRERRYETAHSFACDIRNHLQNQPVSARPPGRLYRFGKFARRNCVAFFAGTAVVLALVVGTTVSTWLFLRERQALHAQSLLRQEAEQARAEEARLRQRAEAVNTMAQAAVLISHNAPEEADRLVGVVPTDSIPPSLENAQVLRKLARRHALAGSWEQADARYLALIRVITRTDDADSDSVSRDLLEISAALCHADRPGHYDTFRQLAIARFADTNNPIVAEQLLKTCLLRPAPVDLLRPLLALAPIIEASLHPRDPSQDRDAYMAGWRSFALALVYHRTGLDVTARYWAERCLDYPNGNAPRKASTLCILALCHQKMNQSGPAREALDLARAIVPDHFDFPMTYGSPEQGFWLDWIDARLLLDEATATTGR